MFSDLKKKSAKKFRAVLFRFLKEEKVELALDDLPAGSSASLPSTKVPSPVSDSDTNEEVHENNTAALHANTAALHSGLSSSASQTKIAPSTKFNVFSYFTKPELWSDAGAEELHEVALVLQDLDRKLTQLGSPGTVFMAGTTAPTSSNATAALLHSSADVSSVVNTTGPSTRCAEGTGTSICSGPSSTDDVGSTAPLRVRVDQIFGALPVEKFSLPDLAQLRMFYLNAVKQMHRKNKLQAMRLLLQALELHGVNDIGEIFEAWTSTVNWKSCTVFPIMEQALAFLHKIYPTNDYSSISAEYDDLFRVLNWPLLLKHAAVGGTTSNCHLLLNEHSNLLLKLDLVSTFCKDAEAKAALMFALVRHYCSLFLNTAGGTQENTTGVASDELANRSALFSGTTFFENRSSLELLLTAWQRLDWQQISPDVGTALAEEQYAFAARFLQEICVVSSSASGTASSLVEFLKPLDLNRLDFELLVNADLAPLAVLLRQDGGRRPLHVDTLHAILLRRMGNVGALSTEYFTQEINWGHCSDANLQTLFGLVLAERQKNLNESGRSGGYPEQAAIEPDDATGSDEDIAARVASSLPLHRLPVEILMHSLTPIYAVLQSAASGEVTVSAFEQKCIPLFFHHCGVYLKFFQDDNRRLENLLHSLFTAYREALFGKMNDQGTGNFQLAQQQKDPGTTTRHTAGPPAVVVSGERCDQHPVVSGASLASPAPERKETDGNSGAGAESSATGTLELLPLAQTSSCEVQQTSEVNVCTLPFTKEQTARIFTLLDECNLEKQQILPLLDSLDLCYLPRALYNVEWVDASVLLECKLENSERKLETKLGHLERNLFSLFLKQEAAMHQMFSSLAALRQEQQQLTSTVTSSLLSSFAEFGQNFANDTKALRDPKFLEKTINKVLDERELAKRQLEGNAASSSGASSDGQGGGLAASKASSSALDAIAAMNVMQTKEEVAQTREEVLALKEDLREFKSSQKQTLEITLPQILDSVLRDMQLQANNDRSESRDRAARSGPAGVGVSSMKSLRGRDGYGGTGQNATSSASLGDRLSDLVARNSTGSNNGRESVSNAHLEASGYDPFTGGSAGAEGQISGAKTTGSAERPLLLTSRRSGSPEQQPAILNATTRNPWMEANSTAIGYREDQQQNMNSGTGTSTGQNSHPFANPSTVFPAAAANKAEQPDTTQNGAFLPPSRNTFQSNHSSEAGMFAPWGFRSPLGFELPQFPSGNGTSSFGAAAGGAATSSSSQQTYGVNLEYAGALPPGAAVPASVGGYPPYTTSSSTGQQMQLQEMTHDLHNRALQATNLHPTGPSISSNSGLVDTSNAQSSLAAGKTSSTSPGESNLHMIAARGPFNIQQQQMQMGGSSSSTSSHSGGPGFQQASVPSNVAGGIMAADGSTSVSMSPGPQGPFSSGQNTENLQHAGVPHQLPPGSLNNPHQQHHSFLPAQQGHQMSVTAGGGHQHQQMQHQQMFVSANNPPVASTSGQHFQGFMAPQQHVYNNASTAAVHGSGAQQQGSNVMPPFYQASSQHQQAQQHRTPQGPTEEDRLDALNQRVVSEGMLQYSRMPAAHHLASGSSGLATDPTLLTRDGHDPPGAGDATGTSSELLERPQQGAPETSARGILKNTGEANYGQGSGMLMNQHTNHAGVIANSCTSSSEEQAEETAMQYAESLFGKSAAGPGHKGPPIFWGRVSTAIADDIKQFLPKVTGVKPKILIRKGPAPGGAGGTGGEK
ncbi:unnamed protein product [Amoebophrya sp. A120]|nr:unnamed protein product [Amoebophrya sp. A120]|eukprot:GSA120T00010259001.1